MKKIVFSLRFSILFIFVTFFVIAMLSLVAITYFRFTTALSYLSSRIMQEVSGTVYEKIIEEVRDAKIETEMSAELFKIGVIHAGQLPTIMEYTYALMNTEGETLPSVQAAFWGDEKGNFVISLIQPDDTILSESIHPIATGFAHEVVHRDENHKLIDSHREINPISSYDFRQRPGYLSAKKEKQTIVTSVYQYAYQQKHRGITIATPILDDKGQVTSVFGMNLRVDYLKHFIESMYVSKHGYVFIITDAGKLVIFPHINETEALQKPWLKESFDRYKENHKSSFIFQSQNVNYLASYQMMPKFGEQQWLIGVVAPEEDFVKELRKTNFITMLLSFSILIIGLYIVSKLVTRVVQPLKRVVAETNKIKHFNLQGDFFVESRVKEILDLTHALAAMKKGLRAFKRYVPATLVRQIIEAGEEASIGGAKKPLVILFSDIKDFTTVSEHMDPKLLMTHMCEYFSALSDILVEEKATIDKYIGDSVMAFWGAPLLIEDPYVHAANAALRCVKYLKELNLQWNQEGKPTFLTRIGLHSGEAIVGNLGSAERMNYTAVGDAINIASRLESINKVYGTEIMVSDSIYQVLKQRFLFRMVDHVALKGKETHSIVYELLAEDRSELSFDYDSYVENFAKGFTAYQAQQWDNANKYFAVCLKIYPNDTVSIIFMARCHRFKSIPPENWDGVWHEFS